MKLNKGILLNALGKRIFDEVPGKTEVTKNTQTIDRPLYDKHILDVGVIGYGMGRLYGLGSDGKKLLTSTNEGDTWTQVAETSSNWTTAYAVNNGVFIATTSSGDIYRSVNGTSFTKVDLGEIGSLAIMYSGIAHKGNTIVMAEYTIRESGTCRVITSLDNGLMWSVSLSQSIPGQVRHFHSVDLNPSNGLFYLTSGDSDEQTKWWTSSDGLNWTQIEGIRGQKYRTIGLSFPSADFAIWGADAFPGSLRQGMYRAPITDLLDAEQTTEFTNACWGVSGNGNIQLAITHYEREVEPDRFGYIYNSIDGGRTWHSESRYPLDAGLTYGGFWHIFGPTFRGNYFVRGRGVSLRSIRLTRKQ